MDFPYFPELHRLFSTRPNITPIAVTTGVGPDGHRTTHYQAPDNIGEGLWPEPVIDPELLALEAPVPPPVPPQAQPVLGSSKQIKIGYPFVLDMQVVQLLIDIAWSLLLLQAPLPPPPPPPPWGVQ
jgi:hypothetical protein